jgi:hypothetical protein
MQYFLPRVLVLGLMLAIASAFTIPKSATSRGLRQNVALGFMKGASVFETKDAKTPNTFTVVIDGPESGIGKFGKVVYNKILNDQKKILKSQPVPGFRAGTMPPFMLPRIKMGAVREICRETCLAALEENGIAPMPDQEFDTLCITFPDHAPDGDVPTFCKSSGWKAGDDFSFRATAVFGTRGTNEIFAPDAGRLEAS